MDADHHLAGNNEDPIAVKDINDKVTDAKGTVKSVNVASSATRAEETTTSAIADKEQSANMVFFAAEEEKKEEVETYKSDDEDSIPSLMSSSDSETDSDSSDHSDSTSEDSELASDVTTVQSRERTKRQNRQNKHSATNQPRLENFLVTTEFTSQPTEATSTSTLHGRFSKLENDQKFGQARNFPRGLFKVTRCLPDLSDDRCFLTSCYERLTFDSGATSHVFCDATRMSDYRATRGRTVTLANGTTAAIAGVGTLWMRPRGGRCIIKLENVLHVPSASTNLLSMASQG